METLKIESFKNITKGTTDFSPKTKQLLRTNKRNENEGKKNTSAFLPGHLGENKEMEMVLDHMKAE